MADAMEGARVVSIEHARERKRGRKPKGPHPQQRLHALALKRLGPGRHADGNGLYLVVDPPRAGRPGARRWIVRTMVRGRRCEIGLGSAALVGLAQARESAATMRRRARAGEDPLADRRRDRRVPTFREAAIAVHGIVGPAFKNPKHRAQWISSLDTYAFPVLGDRRLDQIESADVLQVLEPVWSAKAETARRVKQRMRRVFDWGKVSGFRTGENPIDGVREVLPKKRPRVKHFPALPYADVPVFLGDLRASPAGIATRLALEFLLLTASRTGEVCGLRWPELVPGAPVWTVPGERMKMGLDHRRPLPRRARAILRLMGRLRGPDNDHVFPGQKRGKGLSTNTMRKAARRLGYEITVHGFRSTFRDWAAEQTAYPREVAEVALAHINQDRVEAAYLRTEFLEQRRQLADAWAAFARPARPRRSA